MKKILHITVYLALFLFILYGCMNASEKDSEIPSNTLTAEPRHQTEQQGGNHSESDITNYDGDSNYTEVSDFLITLEYPTKALFAIAEQIDINISQYPASAVYCVVSTIQGGISSRKLILETESNVTYYFHGNPDPITYDSISFEFYDLSNQLVADTTVFIEYNEDTQMYFLFEIK